MRGWGKGKWEERGREGLSVACLCLMEVPGVALGLLHFTINGGSLQGKPCFSITPTHTHTLTHPARNFQVEAELCSGVLPLCAGVLSDAAAGFWVGPNRGRRPKGAAAAMMRAGGEGRSSSALRGD